MRKIFCTILSVLMLVLVTGCGEETQQGEHKAGEYQKIKLVMSVNVTNIATDTKVAMKFAELVNQESGGNITVDVFPNDQLAGGNASKGIEMIADGAVDLAAYAAGVMAVMDEHLLIATIPWTFNNYQEAREIIDTTGGEVYFKFWKAFGADPVAMSWSEAFTAIQQETIDGQENGFSVTNSAKVNEIQQFMTVWNYTYENYLFVANTKIFDSLEQQTQELIRAKAKEACEWGRDLVENDEENLREKFIKGGMEVIVLTPEQLKPFQDKVQGVRKELMQKYGDEACRAFRMKM